MQARGEHDGVYSADRSEPHFSPGSALLAVSSRRRSSRIIESSVTSFYAHASNYYSCNLHRPVHQLTCILQWTPSSLRPSLRYVPPRQSAPTTLADCATRQLPREIQHSIFIQCNPIDLAALNASCRALHSGIQGNKFLHKDAYLNHYVRPSPRAFEKRND